MVRREYSVLCSDLVRVQEIALWRKLVSPTGLSCCYPYFSFLCFSLLVSLSRSLGSSYFHLANNNNIVATDLVRKCRIVKQDEKKILWERKY